MTNPTLTAAEAAIDEATRVTWPREMAERTHPREVRIRPKAGALVLEWQTGGKMEIADRDQLKALARAAWEAATTF